MKRKSKPLLTFIDGLEDYVDRYELRPKKTQGTSEAAIQAEYQAIFRDYLEDYFRTAGYKEVKAKVKEVFYWEGQDRPNRDKRTEVFASRNYPDFIIREPYRIAVEYKQSDSGALVKQGIGQAMMHILSEDYDFVYLLFDDQTKGKEIRDSMKNPKEQAIAKRIWDDFNIKLHIV